MNHYRSTPQYRMPLDELIIDNFAGGGGASTGIEAGAGRPVDIAINHDEDAIAMHKVNHPSTKHYCEDVFHVDPREVCQGRPVGLAWFSPDCKHFSKAKGATPVDKRIRGLAWVALRWAATVKPRQIYLENVEEFELWGPVVASRPCPERKGETFKLFVARLQRLGYHVEWRLLRACDYGAPTIRKRLILIARRDGLPIVWPTPTHGDPRKPGFRKTRLKRYRTAAEIIDWSIPCPSIFDRKKPLAENTLRRIARGIQRFVIDNPKPFIVRICQQGFGSDRMQYAIDQPLTTITTKAEHCLVAPFLAKHFGGNYTGPGADLQQPLPTITGKDHNALVQAFLIKFYSEGGQWAGLDEPMHTIPTKDRLGLVTVHGEQYRIVDIGMRMLEPHELFAAQGFPADYVINVDASGKPVPKYKQVARCGNSVSPPLAEALVRANYVEQISRAEAA